MPITKLFLKFFFSFHLTFIYGFFIYEFCINKHLLIKLIDMNPKSIFPALIASIILISCSHAFKDNQAQDTVLANLERREPELPGKNEKQQIPPGQLKKIPDSVSRQSILQSPQHIDWDKKIIKTATVKLEVKNIKKYNEIVHTTIRRFGGYIAQEEQHLTDEILETTLSIKVPAGQFETTMNELSASDAKVMEQRITSEDVTGEFIDTRSRLESKKQVRLKYLEFLKESKNIEEVLKVQGEINDIQEDIEAGAGRMEYLSHQSALSTINLTFYQPVNGFKPVDLSPSFLTRAGNAFKAGTDWIAELLVAIISVWPLLLLTTVGVFMYKRLKFNKSSP